MKWAVGTTNAAKCACVEQVAKKVYPDVEHIIVPVPVVSAVSAQPFSVTETRAGALHRAQAAAAAVPDCDFGVGLEGGVEIVDDLWFECGWMAVVDPKTRRVGWGSSARFQMSEKIMAELRAGKELAEVMEALSGIEKIGTKGGAMGVLTNNNLSRAEAYGHGLIFALAPFLSDPVKYWD